MKLTLILQPKLSSIGQYIYISSTIIEILQYLIMANHCVIVVFLISSHDLNSSLNYSILSIVNFCYCLKDVFVVSIYTYIFNQTSALKTVLSVYTLRIFAYRAYLMRCTPLKIFPESSHSSSKSEETSCFFNFDFSIL